MSRKVKGSIYRKRYVLVYADTGTGRVASLEKNLFRIFRCRKKFHEPPYLIFRTNQFYREQVIDYIRKNFEDCATLTVSGTMKKCKKKIQEHKASIEKYEGVNLET